MKMLHVSDVFVRHGGGAPNVMLELGKQQIASGHQVYVATFQHNPDWPCTENIDGIQVHRTPLKTGKLPFYISGFSNMRRLGQEIFRQFQPDIIHLHMPFSGVAILNSLNSPKSRMNSPKPTIIYTFHGSWAEESLVEAKGWRKKTRLYLLEHLLMRTIEKQALSQAHKIMTLSLFMQGRAKRYKVNPPLGWGIVPAGVDGEKFKVPEYQSVRGRQSAKCLPAGRCGKADFRKKHDIPEDAFFIFCARRLARRMGLEELIEAVVVAREKIPNIYLVIGGKGELSTHLSSLIANLSLTNNVRLEGFIPDDDFPKYFSAADLFVLPTQELEGFGLVNLESLACGTPVLGTPVGAIPEVLEPLDSEFVLKDATSESIAAGIINYHQKHYSKGDDNVRRRCREYAEKFSWEKMAEEYEKVYRE